MTFNLPADPNLWVISGLTFLLGLLIGMFLLAGARRKWKSRYEDEVECRESWQAEHARLQQELHDREKEWRDRDTRPAPAVETREDELRLDRQHERSY